MTYSNLSRENTKSRSPKKKSKKSKKDHRKKSKRHSSPESPYTVNHDLNEKYDSTGHKYVSHSSKKDICGYTNDANPFMDPNLTDQFVWKKKTHHIPLNHHQKELEIESVQKRLQEHERVRQERMAEQEILQRAKEVQNCIGRKSDADFDYDQSKIRSQIRICGNRSKPIDLLIAYDNGAAASVTVEPTSFLNGLSAAALSELLSDIDTHRSNAGASENIDFWTDMRTVTSAEFSTVTQQPHGRTAGVAAECVEDIRQMLMSGSTADATELQRDAQRMLDGGDHRHIDVAYYEFFCQYASVVLARRRLHDRHEAILREKLAELKRDTKNSNPHGSANENTPHRNSANPLPNDNREPYDNDKYEPKLILDLELIDAAITEIIRADEDALRLAAARQRLVQSMMAAAKLEEELLSAARAADERGDCDFAEELALCDKNALWSDKYRPRKPRFLNRVNTGFDWNKYNQTHYDVDNPPPKIVQGYKFNILYPDLIDKTKTPTFELRVCADNEQQAVITFRAGPPYQDIAFKLVNKEWETSERYGYKCQFYRDMLQLHFHFKRYRYRK